MAVLRNGMHTTYDQDIQPVAAVASHTGSMSPQLAVIVHDITAAMAMTSAASVS